MPPARLWLLEDNGADDAAPYSPSTTVQARLLIQTSTGQLAEALAPVDSLAMFGRQGRPYPPGLFKAEGAAYPTSVTCDLVLTWAHRDRKLQADQLVVTSQASIGPEVGTTFSARLLRADTQAVLISQVCITGATATLTTTYVGDVIVEQWAVRGGLESWQRWRLRFARCNPPAL